MRNLLLMMVLISCQVFQPAPERKMVLVSIDGFRPEFYLSQAFETPTLKMLKKKGSYAQSMKSVFPTVTYPNHTTMVTGVPPAKHGILSNTVFEDGPTTKWYWDSNSIKSKTLWDYIQEKAKTSAAIHWPVTQNAPINYLVPEIFKLPPWHTMDSFALAAKNSVPENLPYQVNKKLGLKPYTNMKEADVWAVQAFKEIYQTKKPDFFALHIIYLDKNQHETGRDSLATKKAATWVDEKISQVVSVLDDNTCLMILGDHGFMNYKKVIHINTLFQQKGWLKPHKSKTSGRYIAPGWKVVAHKSGGQAAIYVKEKSLEAKVIELLKENEKLGYKFVTKAELIKRNAYPDAIGAISANDGFSIGSNTSGKTVEVLEKVQGQHGHLPDNIKMHTGFMAYQCGDRKGSLGALENLQVAPTILKLMGIKPTDQLREAISL